MKHFLVGLLLMISGIASAQDIPNHSIPVGRGPGAVGWAYAGPCSASQAPLWGGVSSDPVCTTLGTMAFENSNNVSITGGTITGMPTPSAGSDVATKSYVDSVAVGLHIHTAVRLATTTALAANTYNNGASGVGATLTANGNGALSIDSTLTVAADRVIVKNEAAQANNGAYVVTQVGTGGTPYILTRSTDADTPAEMTGGDAFLVTAGTVNASTTWVSTAPVTTFGTTSVVFALFSAPITAIDSSAVTFLQGGTGALTNESVQTRLRNVIAISDYIATPTANDTAQFQAAITACGAQSGCVVQCPGWDITYTINSINLVSNMTLENCSLQGKTSGQPPLVITGKTNIRITNNIITGTSAHSNATPVSNDIAIKITGSSTLIDVDHNLMQAFAYIDVYYENSTYINITDNTSFYVAYGPRCRGSSYFRVDRNKYIQTSLYSNNPSGSQFATGPGLDSTDGHAFGICKHGSISGNIIDLFPYSQGILIHAGQFITVANNVMDCVSIGPSLNTYNSSDTMEHIAVTGNVLKGTCGTTIPAGSDVGIVVQGGGGAADPRYITVANNTMQAFNRKDLDGNSGCMLIGYTHHVTVTGNIMSGCGANGLVLTSNEDGITVSGNAFDNTVTGGGNTNGILVRAAPKGFIGVNTFTDISGYGVNINGSAANIKYSGWQQCVGVGTCTFP